jgi:hypothetical protein
MLKKGVFLDKQTGQGRLRLLVRFDEVMRDILQDEMQQIATEGYFLHRLKIRVYRRHDLRGLRSFGWIGEDIRRIPGR